jgi:3-hydroxyisobutyrate dehydrogenase-like beta-hydroxyacid dehydrogenase
VDLKPEEVMTVLAVIGMGQMGAGVAGRLVERGAQVLTSLAGRSASSLKRAEAAGVEPTGEQELIERAEIVMSIVPPAAAAATADRYRLIVERMPASRRPVFIDCNATAPQTMHAIAKPFLDRSLRIIDASIIGGPPGPGGPGPRFYIAGDIADEADTLRGFGLDCRVLSKELGDASALKMSYAGITKGFLALGAAMALGAARNGAATSFLDELRGSQPLLYEWLKTQTPGMYAKAHRWDGEMLEIAKFLEPETGAAEMLSGAADLYRHVAQHNQQGPQSEIISILDRFVGR